MAAAKCGSAFWEDFGNDFRLLNAPAKPNNKTKTKISVKSNANFSYLCELLTIVNSKEKSICFYLF